MAVTEVSIMGLGKVYDPNDSNTFFWLGNFGSAVEISPGLFLSAAHVPYKMLPASYFGIHSGGYVAETPNFSTFVINPNFMAWTSDNGLWITPAINGGSSISNPSNLNFFSPNLTTGAVVGNDLASFNAASAGPATGVVLFLNPAAMSTMFPSGVNFTGYLPGPQSAQVTESAITDSDDQITSVDTNSQLFSLTSNTGGEGASGAGIWGQIGQSDYVLGTVQGTGAVQGMSGSHVIGNYINQYEYYTLFPLGPSPSTSTHNLILGSNAGNNMMRGSFQTTDILGEGDNNYVLAAGNGDTINLGPGQNNVAFSSIENGLSDAGGTTYVIGPGSNIIVGGTADDRLVLLGDRLSSRFNFDPNGSAITANSPTIQLLGGWGDSNYPGIFHSGSLYNAAGSNSSDEVDSLLGDDAYLVDYTLGTGPNGNQSLKIEVYAANLGNGAGGGANLADLWVGTTEILDYQPRDFGLNFTDNLNFEQYNSGAITESQYEADEQTLATQYMAAPVASTYANDDPTTVWRTVNHYSVSTPSVSTLTSDLNQIIALT